MAKRRILKKDISCVAGELFSEVLICKAFIPGVTQEKAEVVMTRILDMQDEFIRRAHRPDGKDNKTLVKEYYRKLWVDLQTEMDAISVEINALSKEDKEA
ncbi:MAG: hypothetical protein RR382_01810 [Tannerellaceae bacterium]